MNIHSCMVLATDKREAILDAALELFVERGFNGTTVPQVATRAGVGAGTIYRYFANKEDLVNALFQQLKLGLSSELLVDFPVEAPARQQFHRLWQCMSDFAVRDPRGFAFLELHHHKSYLTEQSCQVEKRILDFAVTFLSRAQKSGQIKPFEPMLLIGIVLGMFVGVVRKSWEGHLTLTAETLEQAEQCAWEAIRI